MNSKPYIDEILIYSKYGIGNRKIQPRRSIMRKKLLFLLLVSNFVSFSWCRAEFDFSYHAAVPENNQPSLEYLEKRKKLEALEQLQISAQLQKRIAAETEANKIREEKKRKKEREEKIDRMKRKNGEKELGSVDGISYWYD